MGQFDDAGGRMHGFIRAASGAVTTFDVPDASHTEICGINNTGQIVGWFQEARGGLLGEIHGFVRTPTGTLTAIDVPGARDIRAYGIDDAGRIVGRFTDAHSNTHGFLAPLPAP